MNGLAARLQTSESQNMKVDIRANDSYNRRPPRFRSSTDPEIYTAVAFRRRDISERPSLILRQHSELSRQQPRKQHLSTSADDASLAEDFSVSFNGFPLHSGREDLDGSPLMRTRRCGDVRSRPCQGIYNIQEDQQDIVANEHNNATPPRPAKIETSSCLHSRFSRPATSERVSTVDCNADDDYGFLSYLKRDAISETMQKDSASGRKFFNRKKRSPKSTSRQSSLTGTVWCYEDHGTWMNDAGVSLTLDDATRTVNISDKEYSILQKICLVRLQSMEIGCPVTIPKGDNKKKRFGLKKKRSNTINLGHLLEHLKESTRRDKDESPASSGWVFGISLHRALANDILLRRRRSSLLLELSDSGNMSALSFQGTDPSAGSSRDSLIDAQSKEEYSAGRDVRSSLTTGDSEKDSLLPHTLVIPHFVTACFKYIEKYGLGVLGIFRICSSRQRIKQLHDDFDSGKDVKLDEEQNPHDVAAVLKEYFRELPEPLLCKDLYDPFVAIRNIGDQQRRMTALRYLIALLPSPNRDLLYSLLKFLSNVRNHSTDSCDGRGNVVSGNKMDSFNLATLFGPNVLHKLKNSNELDALDCAEKTKDVIHVVKEMIDNCETLFTVPQELHDEVLKTLMETDSDSANFILTYKMDCKDGYHTDAGSIHSSCSNVHTGSHKGPEGLPKSASTPSSFVAQCSSASLPYTPRSLLSSITDDSSFDTGNYVELRSPRLTLTIPTENSTELDSSSSSFYMSRSTSPMSLQHNPIHSAAQLGPWPASPLGSRSKSAAGMTKAMREQEPRDRFLLSSARSGNRELSSRRESAPSSTSKQRPLSVANGTAADCTFEFCDGQETLV